jgi:hypothetical protein
MIISKDNDTGLQTSVESIKAFWPAEIITQHHVFYQDDDTI